MPRNNPAATASEMLNGLRSRLGFTRTDDDGYSAYDDFDEYDDFDDDGYDARYDSEFAGYGADYDENAPVGTGSGGFQPATARSSRFGRADSSPQLVSRDDVKYHTRAASTSYSNASASASSPSSYTAESASSSAGFTRQSNGRNLVNDRAPAAFSPAYNASLRASQPRSEGSDSLYEPAASASGARDSYEAYSTSRPAARASVRSLVVIRPGSYGDAERVAKALKAGDVVVLAMRNTPDDLAKRILDFSFGAASALDASVECPAEKVFAIARGSELSDTEKGSLRIQGVL